MKSLISRRNIIIAAILAGLLAIAFYDVVFFNRTFKVTTANSQALPTGVYGQQDNKPPFIPVNGTDSPVLEEPVYHFIKTNLLKGILPLWNPHQGTGYPLVGMIQVAMFYPLNLVLYLLPSVFSWDILILLRLFLAGVFTFCLMKTFKFQTTSSLTAAIIFMLSGPMVLLQYWTANVDILLPLLLLCYERLIRKQNILNSALLGLTIGLTILGGHPEHIFLIHAFGAAFFIYRAAVLRRQICISKMLPLLALSFILGTGLSAISFFPFLRNFFTEFWHGHPSGTGLLMEEQPDRIITLILPHFFQKAPITFDWVFAGWWGGYLGLLPVAFAFLGLFQKQKHGLNFFFGVMAFVIIAKEYGFPGVNWIGYLPFFNLVRYAIHTPPFAAFSIAVLAGMGTRAILIQKSLLKQGLLLSLVVVVLTAVNLFLVRNAGHFHISLKSAGYALLLTACFLAILLIRKKSILSRKILSVIIPGIIFAELFSYIHRERPARFDSFPDVPYIEILKTSPVPIRSYGNFWAFYPNTATGYNIDDLGFFMCMAPHRFVDFVNTLLSPNLFQKNFRSPALRSIPIINREKLLDMLNVHYIILPDDERFIQPFKHFGNYTESLTKVYDQEVRVFRRPGALPRAFMVYHAIPETDMEETFELLKITAPGLSRVAVINSSSAPEFLNQGLTDSVINAVQFQTYSPNRVVLDVATEKPGLLVLSDAYHPDWRALVDGKETVIYQTNYLIRSIVVPGGRHQIIFLFQPFWFYAGMLTSLASLIILFTLTLLSINKKLPAKP
ncbi:MAG: YfhO family protein [Candidatus Omnitrophota bacterium]